MDKGWIHSHAHTHTMEYYSAIKREVLTFVTTSMNLEGIMLSDISQKKTNTVWCNLHVQYLKKEKKTNL